MSKLGMHAAVRSIIVLAAIAVIAFAFIQLAQHGYDQQSYTERLVVDFKADRNLASISPSDDMQYQLNQLTHNLHTQKQVILQLNNRILELEKKQQPPPSNLHLNNQTHDEDDRDEHNTLSIHIDEDGYQSPTNIIYDNPLNKAQCQNAILTQENIDIEQLISAHIADIPCTDNQIWRPHIWTREGIASLKHHQCYRPHTPVRTSNEFFTAIDSGNSLQRKQKQTDIPVYYHMPKCASSSTAAMLQEHFDFKQQWVDGPEKNHQTVYTNCGFTFVRNPIERFISGYYTINNMLWRDCVDAEGRKTFTNHTIEKYKPFKFISVIGEPRRFETYLDEMIEDAYYFGKNLPFRHTGTQMYFLSNWYGSDIHFFGRVEQYEQHWNELMQFEGCKWFKQEMAKQGKELSDMEVPQSMYHYGFYGPTLWRKANGEKKEYVDALGLRHTLQKMYDGKRDDRVDPNAILAPIYYLLTPEIYDKIVRYFWQDFVCFDYIADYGNFQKYVAKFVNPYD